MYVGVYVGVYLRVCVCVCVYKDTFDGCANNNFKREMYSAPTFSLQLGLSA